MNKQERINQIISEMHAGEKETYIRNGESDELLTELFRLQEETAKMTFSDEHADCGSLKIGDVVKHLKQLNMDRSNIAEEELNIFKQDSWNLKNAIDAIVSGNRGERDTFHILRMIHGNHRIVKNLALQVEDIQGELDAIVITERAIFLIEVKNAKNGILIDEKGNFLHLGANGNVFEHEHEKNFGVKMQEKQYLLRKTLENAGFENPEIQCLLVFTNSEAHIENRFQHVQHCFLSDLLPIIQNIAAPIRYSNNEMDRMEACLNDAAQENGFPFPFDAATFKSHFATVMAKLEGFEDETEEGITETENIEFEKEELSERVDEQPVIKQKEAKKVTNTLKINEEKESVSEKTIKETVWNLIGIAASAVIGLAVGLNFKK